MSEELIQINLDAIIKQRMGKRARFVPGFVVRWLERTIHQDELNLILRNMGDKRGVDASDSALNDLQVTYRTEGEENIPDSGRLIFVSNHPLGGLDGMVLISCIGHRYEGRIKFIVNDLLMAVKPLATVFLPVNKFGRQSRSQATDIEAAYRSDDQMITFPSGLCSRMQKGKVSDLEWRKFVVTRAVQDKRDIVPVYFEGQNSKFFYRFAKVRSWLRLKFNIEQLYLPDEMFKQRGKEFTVRFGSPVSWQSLDAHHARDEAQRLKTIVYDLAPSN